MDLNIFEFNSYLNITHLPKMDSRISVCNYISKASVFLINSDIMTSKITDQSNYYTTKLLSDSVAGPWVLIGIIIVRHLHNTFH